MTKEPELMRLWPNFRDSLEYAAVKDYPQASVKEAVTYFGDLMAKVYPGRLQNWTAEQVCAVLSTIRQHVPASDDDRTAQAINDQVVQALLRYLARTDQISADQAALETSLSQLDQRKTLVAPLYQRQINTDPDLPEWRDYIARDISIYTYGWLAAYLHSAEAWAQRPAGVTSDFLATIVNALSEWAYDEFRKTPKSWTKKVLRALLTGPFMVNMTLSRDDYQRLVPTLKAFLAYTGAHGDLNEKRANDYQRFLTDLEPEVLAAVQAKFAEKAPLSATEQIAETAPDSLLAAAATLLADPKKLVAAAAVRDPDPEQNYLEHQHVAKQSAHKWQRQRAIAIHTQGVEAALTLWLRQADHPLPQGWDAQMTIGNMSGFVDLLYSQYLVAPADWENAFLRDFGEWSRQQQPDSGAQLQAITSLIGVLAEMKLLNQRQALQLPAALKGETVPDVPQPTKVKGKAISMKKARRLLKRKQH
jgi:hypothetical protein